MKNLIFSLIILFATFYSIKDLSAQSSELLFPNMPGIQAYTFRDSFKRGVEATLDTIHSLGFRKIECGINPYGYSSAEFKKLLDARNMVAPSVGAGYDEIVKDPEEVVKQAKALGASFVMVSWIPHKDQFKIEDAKKAVEDFNRVGKVLKENGITFCYHNHGYEFRPYEGGTLFDYIVENTNPEYVSFEMDILWVAHPGADPVALLNKYGNRWKLMHLKDLKKGTKSDFSGHTPVENNVALGQGKIDMPAVLRAAQKAGIQHYFIEDESPNIGEQIPESLAYLKSLKK